MDPEVVRHGDAGSVAAVVSNQRPFAAAFDAVVDHIVKRTGLTGSSSAARSEVKTNQGENLQRSTEDPQNKYIPKKEDNMEKTIFAIPVSGGKLCSHFGHCDQFALVETEDGKIKGKTMHTPPPHEPGVLPKWLHEMGANIIIAGGMGSRAQQLFDEAGIKVVTGATMDSAESLVNQYLADSLITGANVCDH